MRTSTNQIVIWVVGILGAVASLAVVAPIMNSPTGIPAAIIVCVGAAGCLIALTNPYLGLYVVTFEVIYLDYFKKLAVYYGEATPMTISQVLAVTMLTTGCLYLSFFLQSALGNNVLRRADYLIFAGGAVLGLAILIGTRKAFGSFAASAQTGVNATLYIGLVAVMPHLLPDTKSLLRFLRFIILCFVPWVIMAIHQYFFGFSELEWFYAGTGLSIVASTQFFGGLEGYGQPRPIGFGSGSVNYGVIGLIIPLAFWLAYTARRLRAFWWSVLVLLWYGTLISMQRTSMLLPFFGLAFFLFTKSWHRLIIAYSLTLSLLIVSIIYSEQLLDSIDDINAMIRSEGRWGGTVLNVNTFSDRIYGWTRLKEASSYSLLGRFGDPTLQASSDYHDVINSILDGFGVVGLTAVLGTLGFFLYRAHKVAFSIRDPELRQFARLVIAAIVPMLFAGMIGGSNFHTNPFNFVLWMHVGAAYCLLRYDAHQQALREPMVVVDESEADHVTVGRITR